MKRSSLSLILFLIFIGCKTTNPGSGLTQKPDHSSQSAIKGNWKISKVSYPGSEYFKVTSFQIADSKCFIGSTWSFIANNNKGNMSLNQDGCTLFSSPIVWSVNKESKFILKIVQPGVKSKTVTLGFVLDMANQTETSFQLIDIINVGGQEKRIIYQFEKL